jgi:Fe2+ transport system protein FeoA
MSIDLAAWVRKQTKSPDDEGTKLSVVSVSSMGDKSLLGRLGDLGVGPGEEILYFGRAPLGEPVYISVRETVLALRMVEASLIQVEGVG